MSDLPQQNTIVQYVADGISTDYIVPFFTPIETDGTPDLDVYTQAANATPIPSTDINEWNVAYIYVTNLDPTTGGIIRFLSGYIPTVGYIVTINRNVSASLDVEFSNAQNFSGITLDAALDKLLLITQQNKSFALERNISYIINSYFPENTLMSNVQIPILQNGQIWYGSAGGVIAVTLEQSSDTSTLRSELANEQPTTNGAALVGFYDETNVNPTTVADQLNLLTASLTAIFPSGTIIDFGGTTPPAGFVACDGSSKLVASYPTLFAAIGYIWGGSGLNFNVPNLNGKVTAGSGGTLFASPDTVGLSGGAKTYTLIPANLPPHSHEVPYSYIFPAVVNAGISGFSINAGSAQTFTNTVNSQNGPGTSTAFGIIQPTAIVMKIIKT